MQTRIRYFIVTSLVAGVALTTGTAQATALEKNTKEQVKNDELNRASQDRIDKAAQKTRDMIEEYRLVLRSLENTQSYNNQIQTMVESQKQEMQSIGEQIQSIQNTNREVVPLMARMVEGLEKFISLDVPFLMEERRKRIQELNELLARADVSTSEKYRRILESYQVEAEYGRTIEAYRGLQKIEGEELTVDFLRIGRIALIYQTLDGERSGLWLPKAKGWVTMGDRHRSAIQKGLRIARKQLAPDLIEIPLPAPEVM